MIYAGIDSGSRTVKVVAIDSDGFEIVSSAIVDQGVRQREIAEGLLDKCLQKIRPSGRRVDGIVATGYGRNAITFADATVTEITCQARGVLAFHPGVRTIIDIGGQDSKLIRIGTDGCVRDFAMNDRCAAGTGRFLEVAARKLEVDIDNMHNIALEATRPSCISSMCVVFAETEIIGLLAAGEAAPDILAGVQKSIALRLVSMAGGKVEEPVVFTGGVALMPGMTGALSSAFGKTAITARMPQLTGAYGAAIVAAKDMGR